VREKEWAGEENERQQGKNVFFLRLDH